MKGGRQEGGRGGGEGVRQDWREGKVNRGREM